MKKLLFILFAAILTISVYSQIDKSKPEDIRRTGKKFHPLQYTPGRDSLLYESFEDSVISEEWTILNNDENLYQWETTDFYDAHTGNFVAMISYNSAGNDDWLISPAITLDGNQSFEFWAKSTSNNFLEEFSVLISNTGIDTTDFIVLEDFINHPSSWTEHSYDLSDYTGDVHIAFHSTSINEAILAIDDVCIKDLPETPLAALNYNSLDFDEVEVGSSSNPFGNIIELTNVDAAELTIISITDLSGTNFTTNFDIGIFLPADSSYAFRFEYTPVTVQQDTVYFEIVTNGGTVGVGVRGSGYILAENQVQIGTENQINTHLPLDPWYNYSYSQTLYLQEDLLTDYEIIRSISYRYSGASFAEPLAIYMGYTDEDTLSSWIETDQLTEVFNGNIEAQAGTNWLEIMLDTPFTLDNEDNLVIAVLDANNGNLSDSDDFFASETEHTMSLTYYSDTVIPDPSTPPEAELMQFIPNTRFNLMNLPSFNPVLNLSVDSMLGIASWDEPEIDPNCNLVGYELFLDGVSIETIEETTYTYTDLEPGTSYEAGIKAIYTLGSSELVTFIFYTDVDSGENNTVPAITALQGNYPNPFNPTTNITFSMKEAGKVTLEVYNLKGQKVKSLLNKKMETGNHIITWNGNDDKGMKVSSGIYLYKMNTTEYTNTKKMILMK